MTALAEKGVSLTNRLVGSLPKVGIRPAIDGRRKGVRESLEDQTMGMARAVAKLISDHLRHSCGAPVECVIADTCIGGVAEAARAAEKFAREGVGVSLTVTPCWCYGSETMDMDPLLPKAVWGFNGTERPARSIWRRCWPGTARRDCPPSASTAATCRTPATAKSPSTSAKRFSASSAPGWPPPRCAESPISRWATSRWASPARWSTTTFSSATSACGSRRSIWSNWSAAWNATSSTREEFARALAWTKKHCREGEDQNAPESTFSAEQKERVWEWSVKMAMIARDLMVGNPRLAELGFGEEALGHNAIAAGFQGQRQWTDHLPNGDFMEAILNSSFDWNGIRAPYILATENDSLNGVAMLFGNLLTCTAQVFADVRTYWSPAALKRVAGYEATGRAAGGLIHLINSGAAALDGSGRQQIDGQPAMKPFWQISAAEAQQCLDATTWYAAITEYFRGGGFSSKFTTLAGMPITMTRVNLVRGLGPVLQLAEGWTFELPDNVHQIIDRRTNMTWPTTWFAPRLSGEGVFRDGYAVMNAWGANHGAFSYGHVGADLIALCSILRIPVCMHNVPEADVFRPSAWNAFGTSGLEGADFRACANFGPLYG